MFVSLPPSPDLVCVHIAPGPRADWALQNATLHNSRDSRQRAEDGSVELRFSPAADPRTVQYWQDYARAA